VLQFSWESIAADIFMFFSACAWMKEVNFRDMISRPALLQQNPILKTDYPIKKVDE
jgi:hypothetical protein